VLAQGDASYYVEAEAAAGLGKTRSAEGFDALRQASDTPSWNEVIRSGVFRGLADLKDERAIPLLIGFTPYGQPPEARYAAIRALGNLGGEKDPAPEEIVDTLVALLDEDALRTRLAVLDALQSLGSPQPLPALQRLRQQTLDGRVKRRVEEVIESIRSGRKQADELQTLRDDVQKLRDENKKLQERLERIEARQGPSAV
jgi:aminopeptidase N